MSRLTIPTIDGAQAALDRISQDVGRRINRAPIGICPADLSAAFVSLCAAQSCGKCVPCRVGLPQMRALMEQILDGTGTQETLSLLENTAENVAASSDCVIGSRAGEMVTTAVRAFREDYESHIHTGHCSSAASPVPCRAACPAEVDIPGYAALVHEGRYADAVRLIRKDNPFPAACALVCEHPCENRCRRGMVDFPINIRGLKRYAVDQAGVVPPPQTMESTGKRVAIIGGGPSGLTAAYFLSLMGHHVEVFEKRKYLGGMLRYGIPSYRLPREILQQDIDAILATGVQAHLECDVCAGGQYTLEQLSEQFDCVYIAIGAHTDKKMRIEGETAKGVVSSVQFLRGIGDGVFPDLKGKNIAVVGGGNVAMDAARTAVRSGAETVTIVYRRSRTDMPALAEEVDGAVEEGCKLMTMAAPLRVECDAEDCVTGLTVQPQITSIMDASGRPKVRAADAAPETVPCDMIIAAIGQAIESEDFGNAGIPLKWGTIDASMDSIIESKPGIFSGGDCVTGPATAIRAIAAGKTAAANIDQYLGYNHEIKVDVEVPPAKVWDCEPCGRVSMTEREAQERGCDFEQIEYGMSLEEAVQESGRCLRCDHFGYGAFRGGRVSQW